jgi:hypothetical protein
MDSKSRLSKSFIKTRSSQDRSGVFDSTTYQGSSICSVVSTDRSACSTFLTPLRQRSSNTFSSTVFNMTQHPVAQKSQFSESKFLSEANKENNFELNPGIYNKQDNFVYKNQISRTQTPENYKGSSKYSENSEFNEYLTPKPYVGTQNFNTRPSRIKSFIDQERSTTPQPTIRPKNTNFSIILSDLTQSDSEFKIRELCKGFHIVSLNSPLDNITGKPLGSASVTIKTSESELTKLKTTFLQQGYTISTKKAQLGKRNNYAELANVDFLNCFVNGGDSKSKKYHLESSQDLFGSSTGVGRFHSRKKITDKQSLVMHTWNKVKRGQKVEILKETLTSLPSYMRSTQSSVRKYIKKIN